MPIPVSVTVNCSVHFSLGLLLQHDPNNDLPFVGEFNGITQKVHQNLPYPRFISYQLLGHIPVDQKIEFYTFCMRIRCQQNDRVFKAVANVEKLRSPVPAFRVRVLSSPEYC